MIASFTVNAYHCHPSHFKWKKNVLSSEQLWPSPALKGQIGRARLSCWLGSSSPGQNFLASSGAAQCLVLPKGQHNALIQAQCLTWITQHCSSNRGNPGRENLSALIQRQAHGLCYNVNPSFVPSPLLNLCEPSKEKQFLGTIQNSKTLWFSTMTSNVVLQL